MARRQQPDRPPPPAPGAQQRPQQRQQQRLLGAAASLTTLKTSSRAPWRRPTGRLPRPLLLLSLLLLLGRGVHANLLTPISLGIDLGNHKSVVAVAQGHGVEVWVNEMGRRETPTALQFRGRRRLFGDLALAGAASNPHGTVTQLRRLLAQVPPDLLPPAATDDVEEGPEDGEGQGKAAGGEEEEEGGDDDILLPAPFGDGVVEPLLQDPCGRGGPKVAILHMGRRADLMAVQLWAMLLGWLRRGVEDGDGEGKGKEGGHQNNILNTVLAVPAWFCRTLRAVVLDAARLARLPTPQCITDGTALALGYALLNLKRDDQAVRVVAFVDVGHSGTQVTIARVSGAGGCHVLSHSWDRTVGCEALDRSLYRYMLTPPPPTAPPSAPAAPAPAAAKGRGETAKGKGKGKEKQKKKKGCGGLLVGLRRLVPGGRGDKKGGGRDGQKQKEQEQQREQEEAVSVVPLPLTGVGPARGVLAGAGLSPRARARVLAACSKLKTTLSANRRAEATLDCLLEGGGDACLTLTRTEAEGAWGPQITRLRALCARAVRRARASAAAAAAAASAAGVCGDDEQPASAPPPLMLDHIELVGGGSHIPCLVQAVEEGFRPFVAAGDGGACPPTNFIRRTLNAAEAVARGCALVAALHSEAFRIARPGGFAITDCLPRGLTARAGMDPGRLLVQWPKGHPVVHHHCGGGKEGGGVGVEVEVGDADEEEAPPALFGGAAAPAAGAGGLEVRVEEEGCGLVAARGFSRLFSKLLGPSEGDGGEERVTVHVGVDAWGRPVVGAMKVRRGEEEEVVVGAEWEAGALGAGPELEAAAAVEAAMAAADGEVAAAEAARNALEGAVYRARAEGGPAAKAMAEAIEAWLEERAVAGGDEEEGMAAAEFDEKREELMAAAERDTRAGREEAEGEGTTRRDGASSPSAAAAVGEGERKGESVEPGRGDGGGEEEEDVEVVFTVEEE